MIMRRIVSERVVTLRRHSTQYNPTPAQRVHVELECGHVKQFAMSVCPRYRTRCEACEHLHYVNVTHSVT